MKLAPITVSQLPDKTWLLVCSPPKDGAGRDCTYPLKYQMTPRQFDRWVDDLVMVRAGARD